MRGRHVFIVSSLSPLGLPYVLCDIDNRAELGHMQFVGDLAEGEESAVIDITVGLKYP